MLNLKKKKVFNHQPFNDDHKQLIYDLIFNDLHNLTIRVLLHYNTNDVLTSQYKNTYRSET